MRRIYFSLLSLFCIVAGCGGDSPTSPANTYQSIAGNYAGQMVGLSQGVALNADFTLTFSQNAGSVTGTYALSGILSDGVSSVAVLGTGSMTGSVQPGQNPSVSILITPGSCPNNKVTFTGAYDSGNRRLTISGPVQIYNSDCSIFLTYSSTIILTR